MYSTFQISIQCTFGIEITLPGTAQNFRGHPKFFFFFFFFNILKIWMVSDKNDSQGF